MRLAVPNSDKLPFGIFQHCPGHIAHALRILRLLFAPPWLVPIIILACPSERLQELNPKWVFFSPTISQLIRFGNCKINFSDLFHREKAFRLIRQRDSLIGAVVQFNEVPRVFLFRVIEFHRRTPPNSLTPRHHHLSSHKIRADFFLLISHYYLNGGGSFSSVFGSPSSLSSEESCVSVDFLPAVLTALETLS